MGNPSKLPTLQELQQDLTVAFKNDQLNLLLNQEPPKQWIKEHPIAKDSTGKPARYIPIERTEYLLTKIFQKWKVEVLREGQLFNSVYVCIRLWYLDPISGEWMFMDGLGAVGIQTDRGATASDMTKIKQDAVMKALPAAESYAVKDAAEKLGKLFGKDLNRKDAIDFSMTYSEDESSATPEQIVRIEMLLGSSTYDDDRKKRIEIRMEDGITRTEAENLIRELKNNQLNPITHGGNYSQVDIKGQMKQHI